jgi:hypothetical protein
MKRNKIFTGSVSVLIVAVLAVTAFMRGQQQFWALIAVFAAWIVFAASGAFSKKRKGIQRLRPAFKHKSKEPDTEHSGDTDSLMRHVNCRISAYLQSVYPDASWEWVSVVPEKISGGEGRGRIRLHGVPDYNFADVRIDAYARISCDLLNIVPFAGKSEAPGPDVPGEPDARPVDASVWYGIQGKEILEGVIGDLNSRGYGELTVKEDGSICTLRGSDDICHDKFRNLPGRRQWPGIVKLLEKDGLTADIADDGIKICW